VALFFDILSFFPSADEPFPTPDVILDNGFGNPRSVFFVGGDLFVCDHSLDEIHIYRDYLSLTDTSTPDVVFNSGGPVTFGKPMDCLVDTGEDDLIVADKDDNEIYIFRDISMVADGTNPAVTVVTLDNSTPNVLNEPTGIAVTGDDLYVANKEATTSGEPCVGIYRDIDTLANGDAPDVELDSDGSFLDDTTEVNGKCKKVSVFDDVLYVSRGGTSTGDPAEIFVFNNASSLATNDLADAIIFGPASQIDTPLNTIVATDGSGNRTLWVANRVEGQNEGSPAPGLLGFFLDDPNNDIGLTDGQAADLILGIDTSLMRKMRGRTYRGKWKSGFASHAYWTALASPPRQDQCGHFTGNRKQLLGKLYTMYKKWYKTNIR